MIQSEASQTKVILNLKLVWGAFVFSGLLYGALIHLLLKSPNQSANAVTSFPQLVPKQEFMFAVLAGFVLVTLSRLFPKFLFRAQLKKAALVHREQVCQLYGPGFFLGLVFLEVVSLIGFFLALHFQFPPVYWVFGFVAVANMLIRFPSWPYIKFLAEESLNKPIQF